MEEINSQSNPKIDNKPWRWWYTAIIVIVLIILCNRWYVSEYPEYDRSNIQPNTRVETQPTGYNPNGYNQQHTSSHTDINEKFNYTIRTSTDSIQYGSLIIDTQQDYDLDELKVISSQIRKKYPTPDRLMLQYWGINKKVAYGMADYPDFKGVLDTLRIRDLNNIPVKLQVWDTSKYN